MDTLTINLPQNDDEFMQSIYNAAKLIAQEMKKRGLSENYDFTYNSVKEVGEFSENNLSNEISNRPA